MDHSEGGRAQESRVLEIPCFGRLTICIASIKGKSPTSLSRPAERANSSGTEPQPGGLCDDGVHHSGRARDLVWVGRWVLWPEVG